MATDVAEVRQAAVRGGALARRLRAEITAPFRGQATGLFSGAILGSGAADGEWRACRAAAHARRKNQRALTTEVLVISARRRIRRKVRLEQRVIDELEIAFQLQPEVRRRGSEGQASNADLAFLNLRAELDSHAAAGLAAALRLGFERQSDRELARLLSLPIELNAISAAVDERRMKLERHCAWARRGARADPDYESDC
jgi:hypothetical protein